jgi:hypothetical protein
MTGMVFTKIPRPAKRKSRLLLLGAARLPNLAGLRLSAGEGTHGSRVAAYAIREVRPPSIVTVSPVM